MEFLSKKELATRWRMSPRTLERWRSKGIGPRFVELNGLRIYPLDEVETYETERLRQKAPQRPNRSA